jgi:hypothetical protein
MVAERKGVPASWLLLLVGVAALVAGLFLVRYPRRGRA